MVQEFLEKYKFRNWTVRSTSGMAVDEAYKRARATEIADALCSHEKWKNHGHAINRDVLQAELRLKIEHPNEQVLRAMTRAWALFTYIFEKSGLQKFIIGPDYAFIRLIQNPQAQPKP